jgi:hypothetical protein
MREIEKLTQQIVKQIPDWGLEKIKAGDPFEVTETEEGFNLTFAGNKQPQPCPWCGDKRGECTDCG